MSQNLLLKMDIFNNIVWQFWKFILPQSLLPLLLLMLPFSDFSRLVVVLCSHQNLYWVASVVL